MGKLPEENNYELVERPAKTYNASTQTFETANPPGESHQSSSGQTSESATRSLQRTNHSNSPTDLERTHSNIQDASRGSHSCIHVSDLAEQGQNPQDVKDLELYFPLRMKALCSLNNSQELTSAGLSLMHRYHLVKAAENKLDLRPPMACFALHLSINIMASVFLNSSNDRLLLTGTVLNILSMVLGNLKSVRRLIRFIRKRKGRRANR